ncbi:MAG TPA: glycine oxidase ThiO [Terriglobia bacterium]|nr:glycine oxidase ThiO [Terriglobia bacterium]
MHDVIIVGGGAIGLSAARELAVRGRSVLVLDRGNLRDVTSWAAAGMLAPQSEADAPSPFFDLCLASARLYRDWVQHLHEDSGVDPEYADSGLLYLASTDEALCRLRRTLEWQQSVGLKGELLSPESVLRLEPNLTLPLAGAVFMPHESHVTPRRLLEALTGACAVRRVEIRSGVRVLEVLHEGGRVTGVRTSSERFGAAQVVLASGVRSPEIEGIDPPIPVVPRKGQILALTSDGRAFSHMIRWEHAYMVPRRSGELIVGATNEDVGFDRSVTAAGMGSLLHRAQQLSSHVADLPIAEMWSGLRPATPDGLPVIGTAAIEGLTYATGHYRNGILLAPVTAVSVANVLENRMPPVALEAFAPSRFAV